MRMYINFIFCALVLFSAQFLNAQLEESLLQEEGSGASVVLLCVVRTRQVFPDDNELLPRIAYVETRDGTGRDTYRENYHGGIWAVDESAFLSTIDTTANPSLPGIFFDIQQEFGIHWPTSTWSDLRKPFYSALAARLVLFIEETSIPPSSDIQEQANFWAQLYNPAGNTADFISALTSVCYQQQAMSETESYSYIAYYSVASGYSYGCGWWGRRCRGTRYHVHSGIHYAVHYILVYTLENVCCDGFQGTPPNCYMAKIGFSQTSYSVPESNNDIQVPIVRFGDSQSTTATVVVATDTSSGTATVNDYVPVVQAIEFLPGESTNEVTIQLINEEHVEEDETFELYLTGATGVFLSPYSRTSVVITNEDNVPSGPPLNFEVSVDGPTTLEFSWDPPDPTAQNGIITTYTIDCIPTATALPMVFTEVGIHLIDGFTPATAYTCRIFATNVHGDGPSTYMTLTTPDGVPGPVRGITFESLSASEIRVTWTEPEVTNGDIIRYNVIITPVGDNIVTHLVPLTTTTIVEELEPFVPYNVSISAQTNNRVVGERTGIIAFSEEGIPETAPRNNQSHRLNATHMQIMWAPLSLQEAKGFILKYTLVYESVTDYIGKQNQTVEVSDGVSSIIIDGLARELQYHAMIRAVTAKGSGPWSTPIQVPDFMEEPENNVIVHIVVPVLPIPIILFIIIVIIVLCLLHKFWWKGVRRTPADPVIFRNAAHAPDNNLDRTGSNNSLDGTGSYASIRSNEHSVYINPGAGSATPQRPSIQQSPSNTNYQNVTQVRRPFQPPGQPQPQPLPPSRPRSQPQPRPPQPLPRSQPPSQPQLQSQYQNVTQPRRPQPLPRQPLRHVHQPQCPPGRPNLQPEDNSHPTPPVATYQNVTTM